MAKWLTTFFSIGLLAVTGLAGEATHDSIQGVWQTIEVRVGGPNGQTIPIPEPRPNLLIITAKHYSRVEVHSEAPRPTIADVARASADELRAAWGPFVAEAGAYELTGSGALTLRPIVSKNPAAMTKGTFTSGTYRIEGDTLWITLQQDQNGLIAQPLVVKLTRVE